MSWLGVNLNDGLNSIKGQLSSITRTVLSEDLEDIDGKRKETGRNSILDEYNGVSRRLYTGLRVAFISGLIFGVSRRLYIGFDSGVSCHLYIEFDYRGVVSIIYRFLFLGFRVIYISDLIIGVSRCIYWV